MFVVRGDRGLGQRIDDPAQRLARTAVGGVGLEGGDDQAEGAFHLAVGEGVGAASPVDHDAEAALIGA